MSGQRPARAVLDTNVVVSATLHPDRTAAIVVAKIIEGEIESVTSQNILKEMHAVVHRLGAADEALQDFIAHSTLIEPAERISACVDPDDDKFLECAVAADAQFIVSGDQHLLAMKRFRTIRILSPQEFLSELAFRQA